VQPRVFLAADLARRLARLRLHDDRFTARGRGVPWPYRRRSTAASSFLSSGLPPAGRLLGAAAGVRLTVRDRNGQDDDQARPDHGPRPVTG
jgi:hypothetical protein